MIKMNKNKKIIIGILIVLIIIIGIVVTYKVIENSITDRANFNFTVENISPSPVETVNNQEGKNYNKEIDNIKLELNIPNEWNYEEILPNEENDFYKYALKLYKNIAVMNYGLIDENADEALQFIKTINITENNIYVIAKLQ